MVEIKEDSVELVLDLNWVARAGVTGELTLKNVIINDVMTNFPVATFDGAIIVSNSAIKKFAFAVSREITQEMLYGVNPLKRTRNSNVSSNTPTLLMLPGYCTNENPFQNKAHQFEKAHFPVSKGNYANDKYATVMMDLAEQANMDSFGIIAHSQGGMVALHIQNYYWSGLANAEGVKLIQTVATPYQGNTAAGAAADLGKIFGIGCGSNSDLSRDGAANWLQGISLESRKHISFYTVTYQQGKFFGDWCSLPMNLVLEWPNDGVTELKYAGLEGGISMGNKEKWCHSINMAYPSVCFDEQRNAEMNLLAAR